MAINMRSVHLLHIYWAICCGSSLAHQIPYPRTTPGSGNDFIYNFTHYLHQRQQFNSFVIFTATPTAAQLACTAAAPQQFHAPTLAQTLSHNFAVPLVTLSEKNKGVKLRQMLGINNLVFVQLADVRDPLLQLVDTTLEGLHYMPMLLILQSQQLPEPNMTAIYSLFEWCWARNFVHVALTVQIAHPESLQVEHFAYFYTPFPSVIVFDVTQSELSEYFEQFAQETIRNVYGYHFQTPLFIDPPSVFLTSFHPVSHFENPAEMEKYHTDITGTAGYLFHEYIHHINGEIEIQPTPNISFYSYHKRTLLLAANKEIDICIHPFSAMLALANNTEGSYPIGQTNACIIVPLIPEIPEEEYVLRVFNQSVWHLMGLVFFGFFLVEFLITKQLGQTCIVTYSTMLFQPLPSLVFRQRKSAYRVFFIGIFLYTVTINGIYNAALSSILSTTLLGQQINSVDDFLASGMRILLHEYEHQIYFKSGLLPSALSSRVVLTDEHSLAAHRDSLNTSYAYVVTAEIWLMMNLRQQLLRKPRFRIASHELCTVPFFLKFPVQWDSPFANSLTSFFMRTMENGLSLRWGEMSIAQAIQMKYIRVIDEEPWEFKALNLNHYVWVFRLFDFMIGLSVLSFVCEILWQRYSVKFQNLLLRMKVKLGLRKVVSERNGDFVP